jgi:hypothetical protein
MMAFSKKQQTAIQNFRTTIKMLKDSKLYLLSYEDGLVIIKSNDYNFSSSDEMCKNLTKMLSDERAVDVNDLDVYKGAVIW